MLLQSVIQPVEAYFVKTDDDLPGHEGKCGQELDELDEPMQFLPPLAGAGLVHVLWRVRVPVPQVTAHWPHLPQDAQLPSTTKESQYVF